MKNFANDLRPQTIDQIVGQTHLIDVLKKMKEKREVFSILFYGKPGIGKTSLATALAIDLKKTFSYFNAATGSKSDLVELIGFNDILIVDEIHRLNKDKQDILLPAIELGKVHIFATTTENPFFVVNPALRSRMHIMELKQLTTEEIIDGIKKALDRFEVPKQFDKEIIELIASAANGDFRHALNIIDLLIRLYPDVQITIELVNKILPTMHFYSDKNSDGHYDLLSAFHKSLRGSDVDASLYYLAKLILSGDLLGMERRMIAVAYEDVGLASPNVALRVTTAIDAAKRVGFPEARIPLANAVIDLASAPKSNSAILAVDAALAEATKTDFEIPMHLKDAHYCSAAKLGRGEGYVYPHNHKGKIDQQYLPKELKGKKFYKAKDNDKL